MVISGRTKIMGLFGYPVEQSLSPAMHNAAFDSLGLDCCYVTFPVKPELLRDAMRAVRALNLAGINVTVPHKEKIIPYLDEIDKEASFIGAVNTIVNKDGRLKGYNTDGRGFMKSLSEAGVSAEDKNVMIVGAGGASRAIGYYLGEKASNLFLNDIDRKKSARLVRDLRRIRSNVFLIKDIDRLDEMDIIINATPLGLRKDDPLPFDVTLLNSGHVICDLIYKETNLLIRASRKGCKTVNGLGMLLWQGVFAFELWTGKKPPADLMRKALMSNIR